MKTKPSEKAGEIHKQMVDAIPYIFNEVAISDVERYEMGKCAALVCLDNILELPFEHEHERKFWINVEKQLKKL